MWILGIRSCFRKGVWWPKLISVSMFSESQKHEREWGPGMARVRSVIRVTRKKATVDHLQGKQPHPTPVHHLSASALGLAGSVLLGLSCASKNEKQHRGLHPPGGSSKH